MELGDGEMTNPTLERAARALSDHFGCEWETMRDADRATITGYCRAVLMAVREPDEAVRDAGEGAFASALHKSGSLSDATLRIHQAMIDAILAEGE